MWLVLPCWTVQAHLYVHASYLQPGPSFFPALTAPSLQAHREDQDKDNATPE